MALITYGSPAESHDRSVYDLMLAVRRRGDFLDWVQVNDTSREVVAYKVSGKPITVVKWEPGVGDPLMIAQATKEYREVSQVPHTIVNGQTAGDILRAKQAESLRQSVPVQPAPVSPRSGVLAYLALLAGAAILL